MKELLELYSGLVISLPIESTKRDHVIWMCQELLRYQGGVSARGFDTPAKLNRWLGFIQCYLWVNDLRTIDEMRADIRNLTT